VTTGAGPSQPDLFSTSTDDDCIDVDLGGDTGPRARHDGRATSDAAAAIQTGHKLSRDCAIVLGTLVEHGPDHDHGIAAAAPGMRWQNSLGRRRLDLVRLGLVESTGTKRPTPSGALALVWTATPCGVDAWRQLVAEVRRLDAQDAAA
jgi:hypothetical protein